MTPFEARLEIAAAKDGFYAEWRVDTVETSPFTIIPPLSKESLAELRWYLEEYYQFVGAGTRVQARKVVQQLDPWGRALFDAIFNAEGGGSLVHHELKRAVSGSENPVLTLCAEDPTFLAQPWELMCDRQGALALQGVTIRRRLKGLSVRALPQFHLPLRLLLVVSRPLDVDFLDPRTSMAPLFDALDQLPAEYIQADFCEPPTLNRLEQLVSAAWQAGKPYHIVHFDGHGTYLPKTGVGALCFEDARGKNHLVVGTKLGKLMAKYKVPLVLLEACKGSDLSELPVEGSVAPALLKSGVGSVVAFSHSVHVEAARLLVERFYRDLARGAGVGAALEAGRAAMNAKPQRWLTPEPGAEQVELEDWFIPQLYQVGPDPSLIPPNEADPKAVKRKAREIKGRMHGFPPQPLYGFHGRARELLDLERLFRSNAAVVVAGMGGMGKTALAREAAAWWLRTGRFERAVFVSFEQRAGAEQVVQQIGNTLEGPDFSSRLAEDQWATAVALFQERRVLVVWDNFESTLPIFQEGEADIQRFDDTARRELFRLYRELTEDEPTGRLLVTCRPADTGLAGVAEYALHGLARPDSLHLLTTITERKGIDMERPGYAPSAVDELLKALGRHPLSISLVAPHLKEMTPEAIEVALSEDLSQFSDAGAEEERNRSLSASLAFSLRRLAEPTRALLPYLAWFKGGVFERTFLEFAQPEPALWEAARAQLTATALIRLEDDILAGGKPYLRFHPTLAHAAKPDAVPEPEQAAQRIIAVYLDVRTALNQMLRGGQPAVGMAVTAREEANLRNAAACAIQRGDRHSAWRMVDTLQDFLERAGRLRERDGLVAWLREHLGQDGPLDTASCASIRDEAWSLFSQGRAGEAIKRVQEMIHALEADAAQGNDQVSQLALSRLYFGRMLDHAGQSRAALKPLQRAVQGFEALGQAQEANLAAALGSLANAWLHQGKYGEALQAAQRGLEINRDAGWNQATAASLTQIAQILNRQKRYTEADIHYAHALHAAHAGGNLDLEGSILLNHGILIKNQGDFPQAIELYRQALQRFQQAGKEGGEMKTCNQLGGVEEERGHWDAAEAWYARAHQLALKRNDRKHQGVVAQNRGILYQKQARASNESTTRQTWLQRALASFQESFDIAMELGDQVNTASSHSLLGALYLDLGLSDKAETHLKQSLAIMEPLHLPDVWRSYACLAFLAHTKGDETTALQWKAKSDAKLAELEKLRRGESP